jgi:hypothetical protein
LVHISNVFGLIVSVLMAETDKLNIDSIIARLLEGKYILQFIGLRSGCMTTQFISRS